MDITTATPAEVDGKLSQTLHRINQLMAAVTVLEVWLADTRPQRALTGAERDKAQTAIADHQRNIDRLAAEAKPLHAEYTRRGGWTRYYLVEDGHLHCDAAAWRCSRIPSTVHYWMTEHSGQGVPQMIELAGERMCTNCFPGAPAEPRFAEPANPRFMTPAEAYTAAHREQAARAKAAAKAAQITNPDGTQLHVPSDIGSNPNDRSDLIKTEVAANRRAMQAAGDIAFYGSHPDLPVWIVTVDLCVAALAHRRGVDEQAIRDEINTKIAKKARRKGEEFEILAKV